MYYLFGPKGLYNTMYAILQIQCTHTQFDHFIIFQALEIMQNTINQTQFLA